MEVELPALDGFDDAILGVADQAGTLFVVYDKERVLDLLVAQGMTLPDALEHFSFNVAGAYLGESTPAFLMKLGVRPVH